MTNAMTHTVKFHGEAGCGGEDTDCIEEGKSNGTIPCRYSTHCQCFQKTLDFEVVDPALRGSNFHSRCTARRCWSGASFGDLGSAVRRATPE